MRCRKKLFRQVSNIEENESLPLYWKWNINTFICSAFGFNFYTKKSAWNIQRRLRGKDVPSILFCFYGIWKKSTIRLECVEIINKKWIRFVWIYHNSFGRYCISFERMRKTSLFESDLIFDTFQYFSLWKKKQRKTVHSITKKKILILKSIGE